MAITTNMINYDSTLPLFVFGSLMDQDVLRIVSNMEDHQLSHTEGHATGYRQQEVIGESYPVLMPDATKQTRGLLINGLNEIAMQRIHFFEGDEYALAEIGISTTDNANISANYYRDTGVYEILETGWDFQQWQRTHKVSFLKRCENYMQLFGTMSATEADRYW